MRLDIVQLFKHRRDVDDQTRPDKGDTLGVDQTTGQGMERIAGLLPRSLVTDNDGVTGIVSTGTSTTEVGLGGENVGELSLAFVTPLSTETASA